jgi:hypothetical protein
VVPEERGTVRKEALGEEKKLEAHWMGKDHREERRLKVISS